MANMSPFQAPVTFAPLRRTLARKVAAFAAVAAAGAIAAAGCSEADDDAGRSTDDAVAASAAPSTEVLGVRIAQHPLFAPLSQRVQSELGASLNALAARSFAQVNADRAALEACAAAGDYKPCGQTLTALGASPQTIEADRAQARQIAVDVGLAGASLATAEAAFRHAEGVKNGSGAANALVPIVTGTHYGWAPVLACGPLCREGLGNALGAAKGAYLAGVSRPDAVGTAGAAGVVKVTSLGSIIDVVIKYGPLVYEVVKETIDIVYDTNEEDKACESDNDCPNNQYCNTVGENDCRPQLGEGALCSRGGNCLSNCCKPHISTGFLPSCRPADKCD